MVINRERQARKAICKILRISMKRFQKWNRKSRRLGQHYFVYDEKEGKYIGVKD